jgi:hypothetical protein
MEPVLARLMGRVHMEDFERVWDEAFPEMSSEGGRK